MENQVMAISVISISSDSSEDSVGTPAGRVILFGTIPTTIPDTTPMITPPATQTDTPVIPTETPIIPRHHSSPDLPSTSAGPSRKRRRSPMTSVPALSPVSGALSSVRADLIPSPKRVKDSGYLANVEVDPREISLRDDAIVGDALRDRGIDARVVVE
ncbi:hypothetical protein Tco_1076281, partial [Tanacetum coccineum]